MSNGYKRRGSRLRRLADVVPAFDWLVERTNGVPYVVIS